MPRLAGLRSRGWWGALVASLLVSSAARGDPKDDKGPAPAIVWPTLTPATETATSRELRLPTEKDGALRDRAKEIDTLLAEAAQDLGLSLRVGARAPDVPGKLRDGDVVEEAKTSQAWVVSPRIERDGASLLVRLVAVPPGSRVALVREERVTPETLAVRVVVMLRDLVNASHGASAAEPRKETRDEHAESKTQARSPGRAVLSVSTAAFGGFLGYSLEKTSRGDDPRLLYPLMALGTGIGLGASFIVADEWDVGLGDAWYLTAGTWWPTASALLLAAGRDVQPTSDRYAYGLVAGIGSAGVASIVLSQKGIGEGAALLTHSGGALGMFLGGMTELAARGTTDVTPYKGLGYGAGAGWLLAGAVATQLEITPSRVLLVDVGAGIGALAGAAAGSPLLFKDANAGRQRGWVLVTMSGTLVGAGGFLWLTRSSEAAPAPVPAAAAFLPTPAVIAVSQSKTGQMVPAPGLSWSGRF